MTPRVYLKQNALAEPLYSQWYAWPYLVSPMTAPMYVENLHVRLMESFGANPQIHVSALRNPEMAGGPFLGHAEILVPEVARLLDDTRRASAPLLEFARDVQEFTRAVSTGAIERFRRDARLRSVDRP